MGWLPFLWRPLSPDEGGFLIVASQWAPGSSLYGDYWVDRPPVLIGLFALADGLGDPWALRVLGMLAVVATVMLAGLVGRLAAPTTRIGPALAAGTAAVFTATPLFGGSVVNGELLALPFVLAGIAAAVAASTAPRTVRALGLATVAGAAGTLAVLTKQSQVDVFVAVLALVARHPTQATAGRGRRRRRPDPGRRRSRSATASARPPLTCGTPSSRSAATQRGSSPSRPRAPHRAVRRRHGRAGASAAPFVAVGLLVRLRGPATYGVRDLRWPALAVLGWELVVVLLGGSYWLHYLMGLVPGLVLLAAAAAQRRLEADRTLDLPYGAAVVSALASRSSTWSRCRSTGRRRRSSTTCKAEARPGDTAVVAFGGANILRETGMTSPYEELWSLPVRVRDPELKTLIEVLKGSDAPTWVIANGDSLATWGVDATRADRVLRDRYRLAAKAGTFSIFELDG